MSGHLHEYANLLGSALGLDGEQRPFPWQLRLLEEFLQGTMPGALDIPTGLGKTSVMAIWLVARILGADVPRRLVYVVDRRAVVDQATDVALQLRRWIASEPTMGEALDLEDAQLPISTLRGQFVDNREWLEDPARPAIVVGTVDMVGSRLLFQGYGTSSKMRAYHAAMLGVDSLFVIDEAHLVPPFEHLVEAIFNTAEFWPSDGARRRLLPSSRLMSLSATGRERDDGVFRLRSDAAQTHGEVARRLSAVKRLSINDADPSEKLEDQLTDKLWSLISTAETPTSYVVYANSRRVIEKVHSSFEKRARGDKFAVDTELLVGERRVKERVDAAERLSELGFLAGSKAAREIPSVLFATSAGEVGVDLDADHMICDLVPWERMIQRLGRVNRRGHGQAVVEVLAHEDAKELTKVSALQKKRAKSPDDLSAADLERIRGHERLAACRDALQRLPGLQATDDDDNDFADERSAETIRSDAKTAVFDASPQALDDLKARARDDQELAALLARATTPEPLRPALSRALLDAWAMTSLKVHHGRPEIGPWLRGWVDEEPRASVVWRHHLPVRHSGAERDEPPSWEYSLDDVERFFAAARPHTSEKLETTTSRLVDWLKKRVKQLDRDAKPGSARRNSLTDQHVVAILLTRDRPVVWRLGELRDALDEARDGVRDLLAGATLVVDARFGGLEAGGLDHTAKRPARAADDGEPWLPDDHGVPTTRLRVRVEKVAQTRARKDTSQSGWRESDRIPRKLAGDDSVEEWFVVENWAGDANTENARSAGHPQLLDEHHAWTRARADSLARRLGLDDDSREMLMRAAAVHDRGKASRRWQEAFHAPSDGLYAKTRGPLRLSVLDGYRHELGSMLSLEQEWAPNAPDAASRDLALHLVAAHHGYGRPIIPTASCDAAPPSMLAAKAREIAERFVALNREWGPWGLAWWESLLRAADQQASRDNERSVPSTLTREADHG